MSQTNNYPLFRHWYKTLGWIMDRCERMPKHSRFTLGDRIIGYSLDILAGITSAIYRKDRKPILIKINLQLEQLRILFRLCHDRRYLSTQQYAYISKQLNEAGKMVGGWMKG